MSSGHPHMFSLPEVKRLLSLPGVRVSSLDQCRVGCVYRKPTSFLGNFSVGDLRCNHKARWWCVPWSGEFYQAPHPWLVGRQLAIPWEEWTPSMRRSREPDGEYLSRAAACYPKELNEHLADLLLGHEFGRSEVLASPDMAPAPIDGIPEANEVQFINELRGGRTAGKKDIRRRQDFECLGGMARAARCVATLPGNLVAGGHVRQIGRQVLDGSSRAY